VPTRLADNMNIPSRFGKWTDSTAPARPWAVPSEVASDKRLAWRKSLLGSCAGGDMDISLKNLPESRSGSP
jgi:hypothetical protein